MRALAILLVLGYCSDETVSGYADPEATYHLSEIDGVAFTSAATIAFPEEGRVQGMTPCNTWSAEQGAPYPWFELGTVAATKRACPDLEEETAFLTALSEMAFAEVQGPVLILSNDDGREMVFQAKD